MSKNSKFLFNLGIFLGENDHKNEFQNSPLIFRGNMVLVNNHIIIIINHSYDWCEVEGVPIQKILNDLVCN